MKTQDKVDRVTTKPADPRARLREFDRLLDAYPGGWTNEFDSDQFANWVKRIGAMTTSRPNEALLRGRKA